MPLDMFLLTTAGRAVLGFAAALAAGFVTFLLWWVTVPPGSGLTFLTITLVTTVSIAMALASAAAWYKADAPRKVQVIYLLLILSGALTGSWLGYWYGYTAGIERLTALYGHIPGGEIRIPTHSGIRWSIATGALAANGGALAYHLYRTLYRRHRREL